MKKTYIAPEMEILEFTMDDIIRTSGAVGSDKFNDISNDGAILGSDGKWSWS